MISNAGRLAVVRCVLERLVVVHQPCVFVRNSRLFDEFDELCAANRSWGTFVT